MFWRRRGNGPSAASEADAVEAGDPSAPIRGQPGISRPAAILRVAGELERRGYEIVDLFEEVVSARFLSVLFNIY